MHPYRTPAPRPNDSDTSRLVRGARRHIVGMSLMTLAAFAVTMTASCTPGEKQVVKTALDVTQYLCVIANAELPDASSIATACQIDESLVPAIKQAVDDFKAQKALAAAHRCAKDSGK